MVRFASSEWLVTFCRISAFLAQAIPAGDQRLFWESTVGSGPDARTTKPKTGQVEEAGNFEHLELSRPEKLVVASDQARIDWRLFPANLDLTSTRPDSLGPPEAIASVLSFLAGRIAQFLPPTKRLAAGMVLSHPQASFEEAMTQLQDFLPDVRIDPRSQDLQYRINRPRHGRLGRINRISTWAIGVSGLVQGAVSAAGAQALVLQGQIQLTDVVRTIHLELDVNTDADRVDPIASADVLPVLEELLAAALEIASVGDVA